MDKDGDDQVDIDTSNLSVHELSAVFSYYPFGLLHERLGEVRELSDNEYYYNGKELESEFRVEQLDYGARYYDPAIGRFTVVDPISDQFPEFSTYNYASNNPSTNVDLWGLQGYHSSRAFMLKTMKKNGASNKAMQIASSTYDNAAKGTAVTIAGALSPVDEVSLTLGAARRIPGVGGLITKAGGAISKLADDAWSGLKGAFGASNKIGKKLANSDSNVASLGNAIEDALPGSIKDVEKIIKGNDGKIKTDFDLELDNLVIEVTGGGGKGKAGQILNKISPQTDKEVVLYGAKLKGSVKKELEKNNIRYFTNREDLINYIKNQ